MKESATMNNGGHTHDFTEDEKKTFRAGLLEWYDKNKRILPWREYASEKDPNKRAYAVWVSEVMLQQTQVSTVVDYYNRWMKKWPTTKELAGASLEEVNELWAGLGYYSRARRLHEGAKKVISSLGGDIPNNASDLLKELPGVGRYTAGAIASIAFGQVTGVVDGNVIRVLSRLRAIGVESSSSKVVEKFWQLADSLADPQRPGDFNQAMMELGATLCTPLSPQCDKCPLNTHCVALTQIKEGKAKAGKTLTTPPTSATRRKKVAENNVKDIEECELCFPKTEVWDVSQGVCNYPRKPKKKQAKQEHLAVFVLERTQENNSSIKEYLIVQRPDSGLLAGMWEFPNMPINVEWTTEKVKTATENVLCQELGIELQTLESQGSDIQVIHKFSHVHHYYKVYGYSCAIPSCGETSNGGRPVRWVSQEELGSAALSTGMKKVYTACQNDRNGKAHTRKRKKSDEDGKQMKLDGFFKPKK